MTYANLLRHPYWQKKRLIIFNRDEWKCRRCSDQFTNLQVHHLYYTDGALPWEYPDDALITLCELCHLKAEFYKWFISKGIIALWDMGIPKNECAALREMILRRIESNKHRASAIQYMNDLKVLING